ncbi:nitroreductase family deazaflavin-dependent oxidoreductase [soil metagenome]
MTEKSWNDNIIDEFRANAGVVGGVFEGATMILIHSIGAKSGQERVIPLVTEPDGDNYVLIASKGGAPTNPDWYYNLVANPVIEVEVGAETFKVRAVEAHGAERDRLFKVVADIRTGFWDYEKMTDRVIPVFSLQRV